ncbi:MAG: hypothetical protein WBD55_05490 [Dehalococcoidia bacterium]
MRPKATRFVEIALGLALTAVAACALVACGSDDGASANEQSVSGVIIDVVAPSLTELNSFTLRSTDGRDLVFHIAPDARPEPAEGFVPGHLRTHAVEAARVKVFYRQEDGELLALRMVHVSPPLP